jgi:hypothetical protein
MAHSAAEASSEAMPTMIVRMAGTIAMIRKRRRVT